MRKIVYICASAIVSVAVFAYLFTVVRPTEIIDALRKASMAGIAAYIAANLFTTVLRNRRYLVLVRAAETDIPITGGNMFLVTLVRNLFSDLLPARLGTLIYIYILKARFGFPVEVGTSTYAVAFVLDLVVMVPLMCIGIAVVGAGRLGISQAALYGVALFSFTLTITILFSLSRLLVWTGTLAVKIFRRWKTAALIREKLELTADQVRVIYRTGSFWEAVVLSFFIRALKYGCIAFLVFAVLNPIEPDTYTMREIGYWPVFVGASLAELSASTPFSGIGGFGAYEGVWTGAFYLLGYPKRLAALSGISAHVITQAFGYSLGALAIIVLMAPLLRRKSRS